MPEPSKIRKKPGPRSDKYPDIPRGMGFTTELHKLRVQAGITQETLAFDAGIHETYVSQLECGSALPSLAMAVRLADALGHHLMRVVSLDEFRTKKGV